MQEPNENNSSLRDEFRALGDHLKQLVQSAWESEERQKFQQEIEAGMSELGSTLNDLAAEMKTGETGQKIRQEVDDFSTRVRSGEVEEKARSEILKALKLLNEELEKASQKFDDEDA
jgi:hypothetical protein